MAKKECFRKHSKKKVEERRCSECTDVIDCMVYSIDANNESEKPNAVKLDNGKRKYSLIIPSMMDLLLPALKKDHLYYWLREAIMELSRAAHSTNQGDLVMRCHGATCCIQKYVSGNHLEYYSVRALDELTLAMEYGANKPEYGRNNWKKGMEWSRLLDAGMRHGVAILMDRQDIDKDSGNTHVAHMLGSIHMLMGNIELGVGTDDITNK